MSDYTLEQLINLQQLEKLLEAHVQISGMACGLMDNNQNIIVGAGLQQVCTQFLWEHPDSFARCWRNDPTIKQELQAFSGDLFECRCQNGMVNIAMPITVEGNRLGIFFSGQFFYDDQPPDLAWFQQQAEELGFDIETYLSAVRQAPLFSRSHVDNTMRFLHQLVQLLANTGYSNLVRLREQEKSKQTSQQLNLLNFALDHVRESVFLKDLKEGRFLYVNQAACSSLEYSRDELTGIATLDIDPDFSPEALKDTTDELLKHGAITFETRHRSKSGKLFPVEISSSLFTYDGAQYAFAVARNITQRKQMELQLQQQVAFQQTLLDCIGMVGIQVMIIENGRITYVGNRDLAYGFGYTDAELDAHPPFIEIIHPDEREWAMDYHRRRLASEAAPMTYEIGLVTKTGERRDYETAVITLPDTVPVRIITVGRDISERKRTEEKLKAREREFRTLAENSPDNIVRYDTACRVLYANTRLKQNLLGMSADCWIGKTPMQLFPGGEYREYQERIEELLRTGAATEIDLILPDTGQGERHHNIRFVAERDDDGTVAGVLAIGRDITERKQMEEDILKLNAELMATLQTVPDPMFEVDRQGTYLNVWAQNPELLAEQEEMLLGRTVTDVLEPEAAAVALAAIREADENGSSYGKIIRIDFPEGPRWFEMSLSKKVGASGSDAHFMVLCRDITERKQMEEALRESEERFRLLVEQSPDLIFIRHKEQILYANPAAARLTGAICTEALIGRSVLDFARPERREYLQALMAANDTTPLGTVMPPYEGTLVRLDGSTVPIEITAVRFQYRGMECSQQIMRDITERKRMEEQLKVQERQFRTLAENSPDNIVRYDTRCRMIYVNPRMEKTLGIPAADLLGKTPMDKPPGAERSTYQEKIRHVLTTGQEAEIDLTLPDTGQGERHHNIRFVAERDEDGTVAGVLAIGRDITEHKRFERELQLLARAVNSTTDTVFLINEQLRFVYVNDAACRSLGYSREELQTMTPSDIDPGVTREMAQEMMNTTFKEGFIGNFETRHRTKNGLIIPVQINATMFKHDGMRFSLATARDISERKQNEQIIQVRLRMLESTNQPEMSLHDSLRLMLDEIKALTGSTIAFYHFLDDDQQALSLQAWSTATVATFCRAEGMGSHYPVAQAGVWADAVRERKPVIHNDYTALPNRKGMPEGHAAVIRELVVPIFRRERMVAVIGVGNKPTDYTEADLQAVSLLGDLSWEIVTRKQAEERISLREREFRTLSENSPDSIIRYDLEHRIIYLNNGLVRELGLADADEVIGKRPIDIWPDGRFVVIDNAAQRAIATGEAQTTEITWKNHTGQVVFGQILVVPERDEKGCIVGTLAFGRNVTALKSAHERMELLEHAINHGADGVYLVDSAGRIRYCNAAASRALGYTADELLQLSIPDIDPDYTRERIETFVAELDEEASDCFESRHRRRNGELFPVEIVASPVNFGGERLNLAIARDITERKQAEQKLYEKQQRLNDMALELTLSEERERRRIAVDLHDTLGQDLTLTRMKLGGLKKTDLSTEQRDLVGELDHLAETAITRVRRLTRLLSPPILESAGLEAALKWLARRIETDYGLQIAFSDDQQDKTVVREIQMELYASVRELLINIAKHAGTVTACLSVCREADTLVIRVEDDGVGFEAGKVLNGSHSEGFGLFTIKRRITYMGGTLLITSKPGSGTEVVINVPLTGYLASGAH